MYRYDDLRLRKFRFDDISLKIQWINDPNINRYLHFDLPLEYEKTCKWFENIQQRNDRFDGIIEYEGQPIGIIGLLSIDRKNKKAETYVTIGESSARGQGIGVRAGILIAMYAFDFLHLNKIYAMVEDGNTASVSHFLKIGYEREGLLKQDIIYNGRCVNRHILGLYRDSFVPPLEVYWEED